MRVAHISHHPHEEIESQCQALWTPRWPFLHPTLLRLLLYEASIPNFVFFLFPCFITSLWIPKQHIVCFVCFWTSYKWNHMQYIFSTCSFHSAVSSCSFSPLFRVVWIHHYYLSILEPMDFWIVASSLLFQMLFCEHSCACLLVYRPIFKQTNLL